MLKPKNHPRQDIKVQPISKMAKKKEYYIKKLKFSRSMIIERLYIDIKQDSK